MTIRILVGDVRETLATVPDRSVQCCVTSPPYFGLRDYGCDGQFGLERSPEEYVAEMVRVFGQVRRVLRDDGVLWLNLGDSYAGSGKGGNPEDSPHVKQRTNAGTLVARPGDRAQTYGAKQKDLLGIPFLVALALRNDGWYWRSFCPWVKRSAMPESVMDRPANAIECWFMFSKSSRYFFDMEAVKRKTTCTSMRGPAKHPCPDTNGNGGLSRRPIESARSFRNTDLFFESIKTPHGMIADDDGPLAMDCTNAGYKGAHFATFPPKMIEPLVRASTSEKGRCSECGAPIVRVVEKHGGRGKSWHDHSNDAVTGQSKSAPAPTIITTTTGWQPTCECNAATLPCRVLDPFGGAGTTGLVAQRLGRDAILCELNPEYAHMAEARIINDQPLTSEVYVLD